MKFLRKLLIVHNVQYFRCYVRTKREFCGRVIVNGFVSFTISRRLFREVHEFMTYHRNNWPCCCGFLRLSFWKITFWTSKINLSLIELTSLGNSIYCIFMMRFVRNEWRTCFQSNKDVTVTTSLLL